MITPFHIAIAVRNLEEAREFYGRKLGFSEGRSSAHWIDFNMFGHQFVAHLDESLGQTGGSTHSSSLVDKHEVPVPHFGVVLQFDAWQAFADRVMNSIPDQVKLAPVIRFRGEPGEQGTFFFTDPSGNALEFKGFRDISKSLFAS